jgi:hypothetical protein
MYESCVPIMASLDQVIYSMYESWIHFKSFMPFAFGSLMQVTSVSTFSVPHVSCTLYFKQSLNKYLRASVILYGSMG